MLWAVQEHMLNCLDWFAAGAGNLVWGVLWEEALGVCSYKCMACSKTVECGLSGM